MIESRSYHSSCSIDEYLYVIGGQDKCLIEKVNVSNLIRGEYMTKWEPIDIQIESFGEIWRGLVVPVSETEILIVGGNGDSIEKKT